MPQAYDQFVNIFDPAQWADASGLGTLFVVAAGTLILVAGKLAGSRWDDWLDERWGRGSIKDDWPTRQHP